MHTILHISDLHRSPEEPITNATLIAALLSDRDRFAMETPPVPTPDAIIVSGDIIQGAKVGAPDYGEQIAAQYQVAYEFLAALADRVVGGDRRRVVIIPGNHDVCWNTARGAMRPLSREQEPKGVPGIFRAGSRHRWSWDERQVFEVANPEVYRRRLDAYWTFAERFYAGAGLSYPLDRDRGFNLFELAGDRIVVAAFESLHGNDCFSFQGAIEDGVVARSSLAIRDRCKPYLLRLALWHHSVQGPPDRNDYMDVKTVHEMIGNGFRLGLHGHQHLAEAAAHYIHLPAQQAMAVVSAGSLCAGANELPRGVDRQYNIIAIADDYLSASIHVREMGPGNHFGRSSRGPFAVAGHVDLKWERPADAFGRAVDPVEVHDQERLLRAEALLKSGDLPGAEEALAGIPTPPGSYARMLAIEVARKGRRWDLVQDRIGTPENADELVQVVDALLESKRPADSRIMLSRHADTLELAQHIRKALEEKVDVRNLMG